MHDIKFIREHPHAFDRGLIARGVAPTAKEILALDEKRRALITRLQDMQNTRNSASKAIGAAKGKGDHTAAEAAMAQLGQLKTDIHIGEEELRLREQQIETLLLALPNLPAADVPVGPDENANLVIRHEGAPPSFSFEARNHDSLGSAMGVMDFEAAARMSGARFVVLKGWLARMERALAQLMLDTHTQEFGYTEISPPLLVRDHAMFGTAQLPKFEEDQFRTGDDLWLIPTAEVSLTNLVREQIIEEAALPLRFTAFTPCFRREAGAAGRDTRGMIRQHQFSKVELVSITRPEESENEHDRMLACAESILDKLGLVYRIVLLSTGDMGFAARKTFDIEVWLPGQQAYREISSCSNCGDFQARRMNARLRSAEGKGTRFVHSLNGSGLAVGRTLVAVMENFQQADSSVIVPEALRPYMGGIERIGP
jgi:seryl-tRNA synthetase